MSFSDGFTKVLDRIGRQKRSGRPASRDRNAANFRTEADPEKTSPHDSGINRRGFLATIAAASTLLFPGGRKAAAGTGRALPLCRCFIAGFPYHQGPALLPGLAPGQRLMLKREPANPHDPLAIAVHTVSGSKIGYLPRYINEIPATLMDRDCPLKAVIAHVAPSAPPWEAVEVKIRLG